MSDFVIYVIFAPAVLFVVFVIGFGAIDRKSRNEKLKDEPWLFFILILVGTGLGLFLLEDVMPRLFS